MHGNLHHLVSRNMGRPVLMERGALENYVQRIHAIDAQAFTRPSRFDAIIRKLAGTPKPAMAYDDDYGPPPVPYDQRLAYAPRYIGEADDTGYCWSLKDGIALMCVDTPLLAHGEEYCGVAHHGYDTLLAGMREALSDVRVKGLFLKSDSPGGVAAAGIMTLAKWMRDIQSSTGKPIWCFSEMACSAMYWIAGQSARIASGPLDYTGSIGCYTVHEDITGAYEKWGVKITEFAVYENKTDGAPWKGLSEEAAADILADVQQIVRVFAADIEAGRPQLTLAKIAALKSKSFMTEHAEPARSGLALGLVDEIMNEEAFFAALADQVSTATSGIIPPAAPAVARANQPKEQPMAKAADPQAAIRAAAIKKAEDDLVRLRAEDATAAKDDEEENDDETADDETTEDDPDKKKDENEAIAASAEAKAHPQMALAAISSGQTLAQFKASVAAAGKGGGAAPNALKEALANAKRLGPDAVQADASAHGKALLADAQKRSGKPTA